MTPPERDRARLLEAAGELLSRSGDSGIVRVRGHSMRPTLDEDSIVRVRFRDDAPRLGDLLLFRQADYLVVHRYLGRARDPSGRACLRTRGDGAGPLDPPLEPGGVLGRVEAVRRGNDWRSLEGRGARCYAVAAAAHGLVWGRLAAFARAVDRRLRLPTRTWITGLDRALLTLADRWAFERLHRRCRAPDDDDAATNSTSGSEGRGIEG